MYKIVKFIVLLSYYYILPLFLHWQNLEIRQDIELSLGADFFNSLEFFRYFLIFIMYKYIIFRNAKYSIVRRSFCFWIEFDAIFSVYINLRDFIIARS